MVYLGAFGLRWGEVAGLRVDRLDFLRQTITIDGQRTRGLHGEMIDANPKTKAGRRSSLALPDWLMAMLAEILASRGVTATTPEALVFVSPTERHSTTPTGAGEFGCLPERLQGFRSSTSTT